MQNKLIGALVGLARATDGNEHLISPSSTAVVIDGLNASDPAQMHTLLERILEEKQKMVPNCFSCAAPCGRTDDYDMQQLQKLDPETRRKKEQLLDDLRTIAACTFRHDSDTVALLYQGLILFGMDDMYLPVLDEISTAAKRCK